MTAAASKVDAAVAAAGAAAVVAFAPNWELRFAPGGLVPIVELG